jgi:hypothetical protein
MTVLLTSTFQQDESLRSIGWSESVVLNYDTLQLAYTAEIAGQGYLYLRCQMFGAGIVNTYNRFSLLPNPGPLVGPQRRAVQVANGLAPTGYLADGAYYNTALKLAEADFSQSVWMLRWTNAAGAAIQYIRTFWVAGLPDDADEAEIGAPIPGIWSPAITAWQNYIQSGVVLLRDINRDATVNPVKQCSGYTPPPGPTVYTVTNHGFLNGQRILAVGFRGALGTFVPRGQYQCSVKDNNTFTLNGTQAPANLTTLGGFRAVIYTYPSVASVQNRGFTNKRHGRPFGLLRGRRAIPTRPRA